MLCLIEEDIDCQLGIADLLDRDADSPIFVKLGLSYGKVLRFKQVFQKLIPRSSRARPKVTSTPQSSAKPSMVDIAEFSPELRRHYLSK